MLESGLEALTRIVVAGMASIMTGPIGGIDIPDADLSARIRARGPGLTARVDLADGTSAGRFTRDDQRAPPLSEYPDHFLDAVLATEDDRFGTHPGVDPVAVASALVDTAKGRLRGGSTIAQQVAKLAVTGDALTLERKVAEAIIAVRATEIMSDEEILRGYLAHAWFGRGTRGATGAARAWFDKSWSDLALHETALLAGLLKGPGYFDPEKHPDRALARRNTVLDRMLAAGRIDEATHAVARAAPLGIAAQQEMTPGPWLTKAISDDLDAIEAPHLSDPGAGDVTLSTTLMPKWQAIARAAVAEGAVRLEGTGPAGRIDPAHLDLAEHDPETVRSRAAHFLSRSAKQGRAIVTSNDPGATEVLLDRGFGPLERRRLDETAFDDSVTVADLEVGHVLPYERRNGALQVFGVSRVEAAAVVIDPATGAILARVGGTDARLSSLDRSARPQQPGSAIKPFLWLAALDAGMIYDEMIPDTRARYITPSGQTWSPRNYDRSETGLIPLFVGLEESSNQVAARLVDRIGIDGFETTLTGAGLYPDGRLPFHPSVALGTAETTLVDMVGAYASLANGGTLVSPHVVGEISRDGETIWLPTPHFQGIGRRASVERVTAMLHGVVRRGTARGVFPDRMEIAGKTGTTSDHRDAWFVGFTPDVAIGVWVGYDDNRPMAGTPTGATAAAPIVAAILEAAVGEGLITDRGLAADSSADWPPDLLRRRTPEERRMDASRDVYGSSGIRRNFEMHGDPFKRSDGEGEAEVHPGRSNAMSYFETTQDPNADLMR